jgi:hypothetical protein
VIHVGECGCHSLPVVGLGISGHVSKSQVVEDMIIIGGGVSRFRVLVRGEVMLLTNDKLVMSLLAYGLG